MLKHEFFLKAIAAKAHFRRMWLISIFAAVQEKDSEAQEMFPYRLFQTTTGTFFINPEAGGEPTPIDDAKIGQPLFNPMDGIDIDRSIIINAPMEKTRTTIGNVIFNEVCMVPAFGRKFPFQFDEVNISKLESQIAFMLQDTPDETGTPVEGLYQEGPYDIFTHDGVDYHLNTVFKAIAALKMKPQTFKTSDLEWVLAYDKPDPERVAKANPNVPVIVAKGATGKLTPIDGLHRLQRSVDEGRPTMQGFLVDQAILDTARNDRVVYVSENLKFVDSLGFLTELNTIITQGITAKSISAPTGIAQFKAQLFEKYKDKLHDPTTLAIIEGELEKFDAEYLKGDASEKFLIAPKQRKVVRKKLVLMYGAEAGLSGGRNMDLVKNSLAEGWEPEKFPAMNNASRAGSYFRGFETQKGGEEVKWLFRASSNIQVVDNDCKSGIGKAYRVTEDNYKKMVGFWVFVKDGIQQVENDAMAKALIGKSILVRSALFCNLKYTDFCKFCMGARLSANNDAVSMAITAEGSSLMLLAMKAMHGKSLSLAKLNLETAFT